VWARDSAGRGLTPRQGSARFNKPAQGCPFFVTTQPGKRHPWWVSAVVIPRPRRSQIAKRRVVSANVWLYPLPPCTLELQPAEHLWPLVLVLAGVEDEPQQRGEADLSGGPRHDLHSVGLSGVRLPSCLSSSNQP
jgi:hypothetical protein